MKKREDDYRLLNEEYKDVSSQLQREKKIRIDNEKTLMDEKHRHKNEMQILRKECDWYLQKLAARYSVNISLGVNLTHRHYSKVS